MAVVVASILGISQNSVRVLFSFLSRSVLNGVQNVSCKNGYMLSTSDTVRLIRAGAFWASGD
jgi:hypothetical protein